MSASRELGMRARDAAVEAVATGVERALAEDALRRERFAGALEAGLKAIEALASLRATRPRYEVPSVQTPAWMAHLEALHSGRYEDAKRYAEARLSDPTS